MRHARASAYFKLNDIVRLRTAIASRIAFVTFASVALSACEQNSFVPPPPPKVEVGLPVQRAITRYLDATGNTAPIKSVDLVARVQGFLESINYKDGDFVKEGKRGGQLGGMLGGKASAANLTPQERSEKARKAVKARWEKYRKEKRNQSDGKPN